MLHIVHLEDDSPLRDILHEAIMLIDPNIHLVQFVDSDRALDYIKQHASEIDLMILDIRVPGSMDGIGVANKVREGICDAPMVVTSAYAPPKRDQLTRLRCEWIAKPWQFITFRNSLVKLAQDYHARRRPGSDNGRLPA